MVLAQSSWLREPRILQILGSSWLWHVLAVILGRFPPISGLQLPDPKGTMTPAPVERRTRGCPVLWRCCGYLPRPGQLAARTALGLAPEGTGCGDEAGGAHDLFSPPGPHSTLMPGLVLNPPAAPVCPAGRAPRLARRPQTAGTPHRSRSQRTPPLRAPQRCQRPRTGRLGLRAHRAGAWECWAPFFHPRLGRGMPGAVALPHQGAGEAWALSPVLL